MDLTIESLKTFLDYLQNVRRASENTLRSYEHDLKQARCFFIDQKLKNWDEVTPALIRNFLRSTSEKRLSPRTTQRKLSALKSFYRHLVKMGILKYNPCLGLRGPKCPHLLPKPLETDQLSHLLSLKGNSFLTIRDLAILELLYSSGLRISELVFLTLEDLDLKNQELRILGKGGKARIGIIGRQALQALNRWLELRRETAFSKEKALFVTKQGSRLSVRAIQYRLFKHGISKGILSRVHPHRLRHSFASHLLESSQDLRAVQELLGHSNLSSTQIYTQVNFQSLANVYDKCHPRAYTKNKLKKENRHSNDKT